MQRSKCHLAEVAEDFAPDKLPPFHSQDQAVKHLHSPRSYGGLLSQDLSKGARSAERKTVVLYHRTEGLGKLNEKVLRPSAALLPVIRAVLFCLHRSGQPPAELPLHDPEGHWRSRA